jgi:large subunit ribosomal protein L25
MKKAQLSGSLRTSVGKKGAKALRIEGLVPCVLYGSGEQTHFSAKTTDIEKLHFSPDVFQVELDIDGTKKSAIIQAAQIHPVKDKPMHIDFLELDDKKPVKVSLPVYTEGSPIGVMNGGKLSQNYRRVKAIGLPTALPDSITIQVGELRIGDSVRISGLEIAGVTILEPGDAVVVGVKMARGAVDEDEEESAGGEAAEGEASDSDDKSED